MKLMESGVVCFQPVCKANNCTDEIDDQLTFSKAGFEQELKFLCSRRVVSSAKIFKQKPKELVVTGANAVKMTGKDWKRSLTHV